MSNPIIVGVDVSKGYGDFLIIDSNKKVLENLFQLDDTKAGHDRLTELLIQLKKTHQPTRILLVVESTGGLEDNWLRLAKDTKLAGFVEPYRLNPKIIHHEYRVQNRNSISDAVSAQTIAFHVAKNLDSFTPNEVVKNPAYGAARSLIRHLTTLEENCTEHKNGLQILLYQYLPSLVPMIPAAWSAYFLNILIIHGSKRGIQLAASQGFKQIKRVPSGKAELMHQALQNGVDMNETPPLITATIRSKARKILSIQQEVKELEQLLCDSAPIEKKQVELLCSIKGMGAVSATKLLCFIEDINQFDKASSIAAFFGVQPRIKNSGDGSVKIGMSKQGNGLVRRELYLITFRTLNNVPYLKSIYAKQRQKGKSHDSALGVLMHKLIRIIYGMLKSGKKFDPGIDQLNQVQPRTEEEQTVQKENEKQSPAHRFMEPSSQAPITARQKRKRKKDQESQAVEMTESAGSS